MTSGHNTATRCLLGLVALASMVTKSTDDCVIDPNPDIIGVGVIFSLFAPCPFFCFHFSLFSVKYYHVHLLTPPQIRASIYIIALSSLICGFFPGLNKLSRAIESSLMMTAFAYFLTAAITTANGLMDLFHALCLFYLISILACTSLHPMRLIPVRNNVRRTAQLVFFLLTTLGLMAHIYLYATWPTFGNRAECNNRILTVSFNHSPLTARPVYRWINVGFTTFTLVLGLLILCIYCIFCVKAFRRGPDNIIDRDKIYETAGRTNRKRRLTWTLLGLSVFSTTDTIVGIVTVELMIRKTPLGPGLDQWTFGQVLPMTMLIGLLLKFSFLVREKWTERKITSINKFGGKTNNRLIRNNNSQAMGNDNNQLAGDNAIQFIEVALRRVNN